MKIFTWTPKKIMALWRGQTDPRGWASPEGQWDHLSAPRSVAGAVGSVLHSCCDKLSDQDESRPEGLLGLTV